MSGIFQRLLETCVKIGNVSNAHMYDTDFISIEGVTYEGRKYSLNLHIKEETEND